MNPAYMTRQVYELALEKYGIRGHITSLNPIRPENAPDPWETEALEALEAGKTEISSVEEIEGEEYMRSMRPLYTEKSCLKCHARQGYQEGDIRGGISISIPMAPLKAIASQTMLTFGFGHVILWIMGLGGIVLGTQRLRRSEELVEEHTRELKKTVNFMAGRELRMAELKDIDEQLRKQLKEAGMTPVADDLLAGDKMAEEE